MELASLLFQIQWPDHTGTENLQIILRWVHFLAGITWIGLLYFFNLINVPFMKAVDAPMRPTVFRSLTLPALWWFRWGAVVTVLAGFWYWGQTIVPPDARNAGVSPGPAIGWFFLVWGVTWLIGFFIVQRAPGIRAINNAWTFGIVIAVLIVLASWVYLAGHPRGEWSHRMLSIGLGGGYGLFMMLNVWGIIWRNQKRIINGALAGTPPPNNAALARQAFLASRTNAVLSIPMLFFMAAASHYGVFGSPPLER